MVTIIKQKQPHLPISMVKTKTYMHGGCMITIGKIPRKLKSFFRPVKRQISEHVHNYFWSMVLSICISHSSTIDRLVRSLRNTTHRTNHGEFLWRSNWNESAVMQQIALDMLRSLFTKKDKHLFFIIDDTQTLKRAKKMEVVGNDKAGEIFGEMFTLRLVGEMRAELFKGLIDDGRKLNDSWHGNILHNIFMYTAINIHRQMAHLDTNNCILQKFS